MRFSLVLAMITIGAASASAASPDVAAHRTRLQLTESPSQPPSVLAVLKKVKARPEQDGRRELTEVTVAGQIGGMPNPWQDTHPDFPWFADQASFFLLDTKLASQFAHHVKNHGGSHECAFCKSLAAKNAHQVAVVHLVDEEGQPLRINARDLMNLEENQSVVVRGRAELLGGTLLVIHAEGIHVRR